LAKRLALALLAGALLAALAAPAASASLKTKLADALDASRVAPSRTGAMVFDLDASATVFRHNRLLSLRPASNEKLTVAVAALDELGPRFRIETKVWGHGDLVDGVWQGRLVLKGAGDPALSGGDLRQLAKQVQTLGIERITGAIVGDESYFDELRVAPGWKASYYKEESPPLSALVANRARLDGRIVDEPALAAAILFRRKLRALGIAVPGKAKKGFSTLDATALASVRSPRLSRLVRRMNRVSDNFYAEMLLKQLGARIRGAGTTAAGARVVRAELRERGVTMDGVRIVDGSGLSRKDRLTARALAELLISAASDAEIGVAFVASLPVAGVNGTLKDRMESPPAYGTVYAKTGTTSRASALSGYVRTRYVFAILMNGDPVPWWYAQRSQDRFAQVLADAAE
jgi:D-alanyl-D-alanine carboxypeptidase/D-alanyl-D-alanine-endopeptidase (penicillin-binding protein 4)